MCSTRPFAECTALEQPSENRRPTASEPPEKLNLRRLGMSRRVARVATNSTSGQESERRRVVAPPSAAVKGSAGQIRDRVAHPLGGRSQRRRTWTGPQQVTRRRRQQLAGSGAAPTAQRFGAPTPAA